MSIPSYSLDFSWAPSLLRVLCFCAAILAPYAYAAAPQLTENPKDGSTIQFRETKVDEHSVHYAFSGNTAGPGLIFVHGTPGSWNAFEVYLENSELQQDFLLVSIDRPGWGKSVLPRDLIDGDFGLQSNAIAKVMQKFPNKKWVVVGHSLGASLAPKVALQSTEQITGLLLLAGSLDPKLGRPRWYNRVANTWLVSKMIGRQMTNSNREIMNLRSELQELTAEIQNENLSGTELVVMQGLKDKLVSPKNSRYPQQTWSENFAKIQIIELPDEGHFLPWRKTQLVIETIRTMHDSVTTAKSDSREASLSD